MYFHGNQPRGTWHADPKYRTWSTRKLFSAEACNFQDITGQRITKVVNTLKFVEERIDAMIEIWGEDDIAEVDPSVTPDSEGDSALLNGPALGDEGIDQNDIDKLFD